MSRLTQHVCAVIVAALTVAVPLHAQRKTNILMADEIERAKLTATTAYDVVQQLRPRWFATRGLARLPGSPSETLQGASARVWLNDHNAGEVDYLKTIPADQVLEMRWYSQNEAASRFGPTDYPAIEVTLKR
jgi:hypothetical protein